MRLLIGLAVACQVLGSVPGMSAQTMPSAVASQASPANTPHPDSAAPAPDVNYTVPAGTKMLLALKSGINTKTVRPGDAVYLVSTFPVAVGSRVLIPPGVYVQGVVDRVERAGRVKGRARVSLHFTTMIFPNGRLVEIPGVLDNLPGSDGPRVKGREGEVEQAGNKGRDVGTVLKGAEIGAEAGTIGGAATGNLGAGLGYGTLAGAAAGMIYTLFTRGDDIVIQSGTNVEMVLQRPLVLEPAQLTGVSDLHGEPEYVPAAQPHPLKKPQKVLCPPGSLGCG